MRLTITTKLYGLAILGAIGLIVVATFAASAFKQSMVNDRIEFAGNMVEAARNVARTFDDKAKNGEMDRATAQAAAKAAIRGMRYGNDGYFFVYDYAGNSIAHGLYAEREGKNFLATKDDHGYAYLGDLIAKARAGGGYLYYFFAKPGAEGSVRKISSALAYEPWGWVVGTGVYMDDIEAEFVALRNRMIAIILISLAVGLGTAIWIARPISARACATRWHWPTRWRSATSNKPFASPATTRSRTWSTPLTA